MKFEVIREHLGDRPYRKGDIREADEAQVAHLVRAGVLKPKALEAAPKNKALKAAPKNKAE